MVYHVCPFPPLLLSIFFCLPHPSTFHLYFPVLRSLYPFVVSAICFLCVC
jgi:hypothetical protein